MGPWGQEPLGAAAMGSGTTRGQARSGQLGAGVMMGPWRSIQRWGPWGSKGWAMGSGAGGKGGAGGAGGAGGHALGPFGSREA